MFAIKPRRTEGTQGDVFLEMDNRFCQVAVDRASCCTTMRQWDESARQRIWDDAQNEHSSIYRTGLLSCNMVFRMTLMGAKPCFMNSSWNCCKLNAVPSFFFTSSRSFMISSLPSV
jgi:hypothetical protein